MYSEYEKKKKKEYYELHKDNIKRKRKEYYSKNREKILATNKKRDKEYKSAYNKKYYKEHKDEISNINKLWYLKNRERILKKMKDYRASHGNEARAKSTVYRRKKGIPEKTFPDDAAKNVRYNLTRGSARTRKLDFSLTKEQFFFLSNQNCFYCNASPQNVCKNSTGTGEYIYNGLDRVDNSKGYNIDNCVPCCWKCNKAKGNMDENGIRETKLRLKKIEKKMRFYKN